MNTSSYTHAPLVLCILDGWGVADPSPHNAISHAHTPHWDEMWHTSPHTVLRCSGTAVGLPEGQMGNSEVGHMAIGCGRVLLQDLPRIDQAITDDTLAKHPLLTQLQHSRAPIHLAGLLSDGGVHSHIRHWIALIDILAPHGIPLYLHLFLDGRDTPPQSAPHYIKQLQDAIAPFPHVRIATLGGRFYAMDRDQRYERTQAMYQAMMEGTHGPTRVITEWQQAFETEEGEQLTDEFVIPVVYAGYTGIQPGDRLIMVNFRADRVRQLLSAFVLPDFKDFTRTTLPAWSEVIGMMHYADSLTAFVHTLFPAETITGSLGELLAAHGKTQLRMAETEKYAHVTFFFSGGREQPFPGEERLLIPSPSVRTYDVQPAMSAEILTQKLVEAIHAKQHDVIIVNFANADMVGHTGNFHATCQAIEALDQCLGKIQHAIKAIGGILCITADHGNAEQMIDSHTDNVHTAHTVNPVPFLMVNAHGYALHSGGLADIAPTILALLHMPQPPEMTGRSLLQKVE